MSERVTIGGCTLYRGDALDLLRSLPDQSVDCVLTDPPYFMPARHYNTRRDWPRTMGDLGILEHFFRDVLAEFGRVLKTTGCCYCFCDGQSYPVLYVTGYRHFRSLRPLIWDKLTSINGYSWRHQHEMVLFAERDQYPAVPTGEGDILRERAVPVAQRIHPAEKPVALLRSLLRKSAKPGATVLDPFAGSAAVGAAAEAEGMTSIMVEGEVAYFERACDRLRGAPRPEQPPPLAEVAA
jgi:site-specific DNA-methyltransferase (adenine-specific)